MLHVVHHVDTKDRESVIQFAKDVKKSASIRTPARLFVQIFVCSLFCGSFVTNRLAVCVCVLKVYSLSLLLTLSFDETLLCVVFRCINKI